MQRINVVGTSGSGKTTFSRELARNLGIQHVELDALSWEAGWVMATPEVLRERVAAAAAGDAWVIDGNYSAMRDLIWGRADTVIWLDLPFPVVMWRVIARTARRLATREVLWSGNRESARTAVSRDSIILWALTNYPRNRRKYPRLLAERPDLRAIRLRSVGQMRGLLAAIEFPAPNPATEPRSQPAKRPAGSSPGAGTTPRARGRR